jgi:hypothetical protein
MPRYMIERLFDQGEPPTPAASQLAIRLMEEDFSDLTWEHSHVIVDDDNGYVRTFCVYQAPDAQRVYDHSSCLVKHTILNIYEIEADVAPADIPPEGEPLPNRYVSPPDAG